MRPAERRARPRMTATAIAIPTAADAKLWNASCDIWERYDMVDSPAYDCQFVFVVNDAAVSNACRSMTPERCCGLNGKSGCRRSTTYVSTIDAALNNSTPPR